MSFAIHYGLHAAAREDHADPAETLRAANDLALRGAKYIQIFDDQDREFTLDQFSAFVDTPTKQ